MGQKLTNLRTMQVCCGAFASVPAVCSMSGSQVISEISWVSIALS